MAIPGIAHWPKSSAAIYLVSIKIIQKFHIQKNHLRYLQLKVLFYILKPADNFFQLRKIKSFPT